MPRVTTGEEFASRVAHLLYSATNQELYDWERGNIATAVEALAEEPREDKLQLVVDYTTVLKDYDSTTRRIGFSVAALQELLLNPESNMVVLTSTLREVLNTTP